MLANLARFFLFFQVSSFAANFCDADLSRFPRAWI